MSGGPFWLSVCVYFRVSQSVNISNVLRIAVVLFGGLCGFWRSVWMLVAVCIPTVACVCRWQSSAIIAVSAVVCGHL